MPFKIKQDSVTLSGSGSGTVSFEIDAGMTMTILKLAQTSTGAYNITKIRDTATGNHFLSGTIDNTMLEWGTNNHLNITDIPIVLTGPTKLILDLTDTSTSSNTVSVAIIGDESAGGRRAG